jgi:antitoxin HicB
MRTIEEYMHLPYRYVLTHDEDEDGNEGFVAEVEELPGVYSQGETPQIAIEGIHDAMLGWLSVALEDGMSIPEPRNPADCSGRVLLRIPVSLHAELKREAEREGVSLNQFISSALAGAIDWRRQRVPA